MEDSFVLCKNASNEPNFIDFDEAIHNIDKLIDELNNLKCILRLDVLQKEHPNVNQILDFLANVPKIPIEETALAINKVSSTLLKYKWIVTKCVKTIAEIARTDQGRKECTTIELIRVLIDLLKEDDIDILTYACRALSYICHNNENGKNLVREQDGLKVILTVLKKGIALDNVEGASSLRLSATSVLYLVLVGQKALCIKAFEEDMLAIICSILEKDIFRNSRVVRNMLITCKMFDKQNIVFLDERLTRVLVDIMTSNIPLNYLSVRCLEIFLGQAKDKKAKLLLAKVGVCKLLLKLLEEYSPQCDDEEIRSILKCVSDLIVLILTGDGMNLLYNDGNGTVYKKLAGWLNSANNDVCTTAVLSMPQFARTHTHRMRMLKDGIYDKMLHLLKKADESVDMTCRNILVNFSAQRYILRSIKKV